MACPASLRRVVMVCLILPVNFSGGVVSAESNPESLRRTPIVQAIERAIPAVVNIHGQKTIEATAATGGDPTRRVNGMGTGVIIDQRGYILTNYHVIDGVRPIQVTLQDHRTYTARQVARDTHTDLAIIKIKTNEPLPLIPVGTSGDLMLGERVIAIGNAYGYHDTVTVGIISSLNRTVEVTDSQRYYDLIQTDASINPGNSGGPLLNVDGQMIGINVAVRVGADGIAFAIPVDRAVQVAADLLATEQISGTWHGVEGQSLVRSGDWNYIVEHVRPGSPAADSGIRPGDRIARIGGLTIERQLDVERALLGLAPGSEARVEVVREERALPIQLVVAHVPDTTTASTADQMVWTRLGLRLSPVLATELLGLESQYNGGLRLTAVRADSPAARHGLRVGDILVGVMEWETIALRDLDYILGRMDALNQRPVPFYVVRNRETHVGQLSLTRR